MGFSGGAQTRYKKYPCKGSCKRNSYETICKNIVSRYQTLVSSLPREAVFRRRRPKAHFMTGRTGSPVINCSIINSICPAQLKLARVTPIRFTNRGVKPILTIIDLYQSSLSFRRFSRNVSANTSHCFSHLSRFTVQMPIGF